ncbi:MmcQ/YjbR family DNA-binding protein [bacterium]|nr:MmcQ/YjbR family DNA-binding protein [bacterium]
MEPFHLNRVQRICHALPETEERISHGEPTFFVRKRVYTMFATNHHNDGRIAVWLPVPAGAQEMLIAAEPGKFFKPPYVGVRGWVGIVLDAVDDDELSLHINEAWRMIAPKRLREMF